MYPDNSHALPPGEYCGVRVNSFCEDGTCQSADSQANCVDTGSDVFCECSPFYRGDDCDEPINDCRGQFKLYCLLMAPQPASSSVNCTASPNVIWNIFLVSYGCHILPHCDVPASQLKDKRIWPVSPNVSKPIHSSRPNPLQQNPGVCGFKTLHPFLVSICIILCLPTVLYGMFQVWFATTKARVLMDMETSLVSARLAILANTVKGRSIRASLHLATIKV